MNETEMHKSQGIIEFWKNLEYVWAQKLCLQRQKSQAQRVDTVKIRNISLN
jgi:hypothetical protein